MQKCALLPRRAINHFPNEPRDFFKTGMAVCGLESAFFTPP